MKLKYKEVQALKYELGQLINTNPTQGNLEIENITSNTMAYFVKLFKVEKPNHKLTIASLFYFINDYLDDAYIIKGVNLL